MVLLTGDERLRVEQNAADDAILTNRLAQQFGGDEGVDERPLPVRRAPQRAAEPLGFLLGVHRASAPTALGEPGRAVWPTLVVIPEGGRVEQYLLAALRTLGAAPAHPLLEFRPHGFVDAEYFDRDPTSRGAQRIDSHEHRLLRLPGKERKQSLGQPCRGDVRHKAGVAYRGWLKGYGNLLVLDHGDGYYTLYAHASQLLVDEGDQVKGGDLIGRVGETGSVEGPRLHFEVRYQSRAEDPQLWLRRRP